MVYGIVEFPKWEYCSFCRRKRVKGVGDQKRVDSKKKTWKFNAELILILT